jgi:hypothetical protein
VLSQEEGGRAGIQFVVVSVVAVLWRCAGVGQSVQGARRDDWTAASAIGEGATGGERASELASVGRQGRSDRRRARGGERVSVWAWADLVQREGDRLFLAETHTQRSFLPRRPSCWCCGACIRTRLCTPACLDPNGRVSAGGIVEISRASYPTPLPVSP